MKGAALADAAPLRCYQVLVICPLCWYNQSMSKEQEMVLWMNIMMTEIRKRFNISRLEFVPIAQKYNLIAFLLDQYELLHY